MRGFAPKPEQGKKKKTKTMKTRQQQKEIEYYLKEGVKSYSLIEKLKAENKKQKAINSILIKALTRIAATQYRNKGGKVDTIELDHCIRIAYEAIKLI